MKKDTSWEAVSKWYDEYLEGNSDSYQEKVILPSLLRIMDIKKGERILDIACGQGYFSRHFRDAGAIMTGVDLSADLIAIAKNHEKQSNQKNPIVFYKGSAEREALKKWIFLKVELSIRLSSSLLFRI